MERKDIRKRKSEKGFTLVELMIVIAIIAILAAVAIPQYNAYKRKAKAKELVTVARACAQEYVAQCMVDSNVQTTNLASCNASSYSSIEYITSLTLSPSLSCTNGEASGSVLAQGTVDNKQYTANCTVTPEKISCKGVY